MFFQLEDVKRRRPAYSDFMNIGAYVDPLDSKLTWNLQRGFIVGFIANTTQAYLSNLFSMTRQALKIYEPPSNIKQTITLLNMVRGMEDYNIGFKNRFNHSLLFTTIYTMPLLAYFRYIDGGWHNLFAGFDINFIRKLPGQFMVSLFASPLAVIPQMAQRAYLADLTFPKELQRGYKNIYDAMFRSIKQNGIYYLYKGSSPIMIGQILFTFTTFANYQFLRDKFSFLHMSGGVSCNITILVSALISTFTGCIFSYPFYNIARQYVDFTPTKDNKKKFGGNYRSAMAHIFGKNSLNDVFIGIVPRFFMQRGIGMFLTLILAQKLGMFTKWRIDAIGGAGDNNYQDSFI